MMTSPRAAWRSRRAADLPFALLLAMGGLFLAGLAVVAVAGASRTDPLALCQEAALGIASKVTAIGVLTPVGLISVVVLAGFLALAHQLWETRRTLRRLLEPAQPAAGGVATAATAAGLGGQVAVVPDAGSFVFCHGYLRPRVCISQGLVDILDAGELEAVFRHEAHHARHKDPLKILVGRAVASGLFFLPAAGALRNSFLAGKEISADEAARRAGSGLALPSALVKMLRAERPTWPAGVLAIGALSPTEARIRSLLRPDESTVALPRFTDWIVSAAVVAGIFGVSLGATAAATHDVHSTCDTGTTSIAAGATLPGP